MIKLTELDNMNYIVYNVNTVTMGFVSVATLKPSPTFHCKICWSPYRTFNVKRLLTLSYYEKWGWAIQYFFIIIKRSYPPQEDIGLLVKTQKPRKGFLCFAS